MVRRTKWGVKVSMQMCRPVLRYLARHAVETVLQLHGCSHSKWFSDLRVSKVAAVTHLTAEQTLILHIHTEKLSYGWKEMHSFGALEGW